MMTRCNAAPRARTRFAHDSRSRTQSLSAKDCRPRARLFLSRRTSRFLASGRGERQRPTQDGVRRVINLSIETHPDMMSLCTGLGTHGHAWVRCAPRAVSRPTPPPGARARPISRHTPDASHLTARPPAHAHGSTAQSTESHRRQDTSHKDAHYKSPQGSAQMPPPRACKSRSCTNAQSMHLPAISTEYVSSPAPVSHGIA
jgi:hypothetical protein